MVLVTKYPLNSNCLFIDPPKLYVEVNTALQSRESALLRDARIIFKQVLLKTCISAVRKTIFTLIQRNSITKILLLRL